MLTDEQLAELKRLEESLWIADTRFDRDYIDSVLAPDFAEFGRSGRVYTRDDILDSPARAINARLPLPRFEAHGLANAVVLITYVSELGGDELETSNRSSVWVRVDGGWKLRFHQGTPVAGD